jgi:hypothetical protein
MPSIQEGKTRLRQIASGRSRHNPVLGIVALFRARNNRNGIDGLSRLCRDIFKSDPFSGWLFVFRNRRGSALKILAFDSC